MAARSRLAGTVFVALIAVAFVLSFADRAPDIVFPAVASFGGAVEGATGIELVGRGGLPVELDTIGHIVLWGTLAAASWWTFHRRVPVFTQALGLFAASCAVEVGQFYVTSSRVPDPADLVANAIGITAGLGAALVIGSSIDAARRRTPARVRVD